ncbi:MAG: chorismate mutase [Candidatus Lokiarchaeota archaeon]|nr:chorismate mutase [Candidatus Lokiarchaeota archaeon]
MNHIQKFRELINEIDIKIADLIEERVEIAKKVGILKSEMGLPVIQPEREDEIIRDMKKTIKSISPESISAIWNEIIRACRSVEEGQFRICYLSGTDSGLASENFFNSANSIITPLTTCEEISTNIVEGHYRYGVIPIESSSEGTIKESLDILIEHDLIIYGEEFIQNSDESYTRFLIISTQEHEPTENDKTSIIFVTLDKPGQLSKVIQLFAEMNINLTKIESRPRKRDNDTWEYVFFLEFDGNLHDSRITAILDQMSNFTTWIKVLGSYPKKAEV